MSAAAAVPARVSVVVPVLDGERYLGEALDSIVAQGEAILEVIVVDDGSSDRSAEIADAFGPPVRVVRQAHGGIGAARNRGVAEAVGSHIGFLDADDRWEEGRLEARLRRLDGPSGPDLVFGHAEQFLSPDLSPEERARLRCPAGAQPAMLIGTLLARLDRFRSVGPFSESLATGEFVEWMLRARAAGLRETMLPQRVLWRRIHGTNHGRVRRDAAADYLKVARAALARRRTGGAP